MTIEEMAAKARSAMPGGGDAAGVDLATIVKVIELALEVFACFATSPAAAVTACRQPTLIQRFRVRGLVRRALPGSSLATQLRVQLGLQAMAGTLTEDDVRSAVAQKAEWGA